MGIEFCVTHLRAEGGIEDLTIYGVAAIGTVDVHFVWWTLRIPIKVGLNSVDQQSRAGKLCFIDIAAAFAVFQHQILVVATWDCDLVNVIIRTGNRMQCISITWCGNRQAAQPTAILVLHIHTHVSAAAFHDVPTSGGCNSIEGIVIKVRSTYAVKHFVAQSANAILVFRLEGKIPHLFAIDVGIGII
ncbi:hypothetical protein DSECCO2_525000 [anaerobic digester metagenome]